MFKLPDLGEGITSGEIKKWLVARNEKVEEDQGIVEVETDKAVVELPSPIGGVIEDLRAVEGAKVNVGDVIAVIREEGAPEAVKPPEAAKPAEAGVPVLATPSTRMLAKQLGVDINVLRGTGPGGRITDEDVRKATEKPAVPPIQAAPPKVPAAAEERLPLRGTRKTIAEHLMASLSRTAHVTLIDDVDLTELAALRDRVNRKLAGTAKVSYLAFMVKAVVAALKSHPILNASVDDEKGEIVIKKYYNIGIAVDTDRGLIVPVLKDADKKSIIEISRELVHIIELTREGKIGLEQLKGGTFTIANIGSIGGLFSTPIINYPESAIIEMQQIRDSPRIVNGTVAIRKAMYLPLTVDHRIIDGAEGQRFLNDLKRYLEDPDLLLVNMV